MIKQTTYFNKYLNYNLYVTFWYLILNLSYIFISLFFFSCQLTTLTLQCISQLCDFNFLFKKNIRKRCKKNSLIKIAKK